MAVTITRSVWIDDDGTGTTGTVINQALHTTLYNEIDTALAKVAQLTGGNTFTGAQTVTGALSLPSPIAGCQVAIPVDGGALVPLGLKNTNPANSINYVLFLNSTSGATGNIAQASATTVVYGTSSDARLKDDLGPATDLHALRAVVVHDFTWKADGVRARGVFAQDVAPVFPHAVVEGTDERTAAGTLARPWMTDYSKFVADLIVGWQQHDAELAALRALLAGV